MSIHSTYKGELKSSSLNQAEILPCLEETFGFLGADKLAVQDVS